MKRSIATSMLVLALSVAGCRTSQIFSDNYTKEANRLFSVAEANPEKKIAEEERESLIRLWADKPVYVELLRDERKWKKMPRLVSYKVPVYPLNPFHAIVKAMVVVSFVVDRTGRVEAVRVIESSDSRFDQSAVEAVTTWTFLPAEYGDGPTSAILAVPVNFSDQRPPPGWSR